MSAVTLPIDVRVTKTEGKARIESGLKLRPVTSWQTELSCISCYHSRATAQVQMAFQPWVSHGQHSQEEHWLTKHPVSLALTHLIWPRWFLYVLAGTWKHCRALDSLCSWLVNFLWTLCLWPALQAWKNDSQVLWLHNSVADEFRVFTLHWNDSFFDKQYLNFHIFGLEKAIIQKQIQIYFTVCPIKRKKSLTKRKSFPL